MDFISWPRRMGPPCRALSLVLSALGFGAFITNYSVAAAYMAAADNVL